MRIAKSVGYALLLAAALVAFPTISRADTYLFTSDHCTGGCGTTPFGQVVVTGGSGTLDFAVTLFDSNQFINTGQPLSFGFNLAGNPTITYVSLTTGWTIPGGSSPDQNAGSYHQDGTGNFEYGVSWFGNGGQGSSNPGGSSLNFEITGTGLALSSIEKNAAGQFFAADILSGTTNNTGSVDVSNSAVPEPSALLLVGTALLGIGYSVRNRIFRRTKEELAAA
jgi:hypothetical protein